MNQITRKFVSAIAMTALLAISAIIISACAEYRMHPGAVSVSESKTYDVINDANSVLNFAGPKLSSGELPARLKPYYNTLEDAYRVAYRALQAYDDAVHAGQAADAKLTQLNAARAALDSALNAFKGAK